MNGDYNVLDTAASEQGLRREIWHGWSYARNHREEFEERKAEIIRATRDQLAAFRIFVAAVGTERRLPERIEAAVMNHLNTQPPPYRDIPDQGMMLAPRRSHEAPIQMTSRMRCTIHALPQNIEI